MACVATNIIRWIILLIQLTTFFICVLGTLTDNHYSQETCIKTDKLPFSLKFTTVSSKIQCATKCDNKCNAFVVTVDKSNKKKCALISNEHEIQFDNLVNCNDKQVTARVYKNLNFQDAQTCKNIVKAFGHQYCVVDTLTNASSVVEANSTCDERGGQLPVVEYQEDLLKIPSTSEWVWMGGNALNVGREFVWSNGYPVPATQLPEEAQTDGLCMVTDMGFLLSSHCHNFTANVVCAIRMI